MKKSSIVIAGLICLVAGAPNAESAQDDLSSAFVATEKIVVVSEPKGVRVSYPSATDIVVCTATCLIGDTFRISHFLVQGVGATRAEAMIGLKAACDKKFSEVGSARQSALVTSSGGEKRGKTTTDFDINKACTN